MGPIFSITGLEEQKNLSNFLYCKVETREYPWAVQRGAISIYLADASTLESLFVAIFDSVIRAVCSKINPQSLEDTQVRNILQKYILNKYTLEKYTLKNSLWKNKLKGTHFEKMPFGKIKKSKDWSEVMNLQS